MLCLDKILIQKQTWLHLYITQNIFYFLYHIQSKSFVCFFAPWDENDFKSVQGQEAIARSIWQG